MTRHEAEILQTALADLQQAHAQIAEAKVRGLLKAAEREFSAEDRFTDECINLGGHHEQH